MVSLQSGIVDELEVLSSNTEVEDISSATHAIYTEMVSNVASQLGTPFKELSNAILNLSLSDAENVISEHESFRQDQTKRLIEVKVKLAKLAKDVPDVTTVSTSTSRIPAARSVEMEKCKATWSLREDGVRLLQLLGTMGTNLSK